MAIVRFPSTIEVGNKIDGSDHIARVTIYSIRVQNPRGLICPIRYGRPEIWQRLITTSEGKVDQIGDELILALAFWCIFLAYGLVPFEGLEREALDGNRKEIALVLRICYPDTRRYQYSKLDNRNH